MHLPSPAHLARATATSVIVLVLSACAEPDPAPIDDPCAGRPPTLEARVAEALEGGVIPGALVYRDFAEPHVLALGVADVANETPLGPDVLFRTASVGKLYLALLAVILDAEGALDLDAPIADRLDEEARTRLPNTDRITLRQLLEHRSGLHDFVGVPAYEADVRADPARVRTDRESIAYVFDRAADFAPGARYAYSNTGYCVASLVIADATGAHPSVALREKVLAPFGLDETWWENHEAFDEARLVHGYDDTDGDGAIDDVRDLELLTGLGAGGLVSTAADVAELYRALFAGEGFPDDAYDRDALLAELLADADGDGYGLGIQHPPSVFFHAGEVPGYGSFAAHLVEGERTVVLLVNRSPSVVTEEPAVRARIDRLWDDVVCDALGR